MKKLLWLIFLGMTACGQVTPTPPEPHLAEAAATITLDPAPATSPTALASLPTPTVVPISSPPRISSLKPQPRLNEGATTHFLLASSGSVHLKREGWPEYLPVAFGELLQGTDLLQVQAATNILCADLSVVSISALGTPPCPAGPSILVYKEAAFIVRAEPPDPKIPYTLYPRNTLVLENRPTLRWHDTGASSYTVGIIYDKGELWSLAKVTGSVLPYPAEQPSLESDVDYHLVVVDNDTGIGSTKNEPPGMDFRLANEAELISIDVGRTQIMTLNQVSEPERDFALAVYYTGLTDISTSGFAPFGEAWLIFESLAQSYNTPAIHLWRGRLSSHLQLANEAQLAYQAALQSAEALGDLAGQADGQAGLWCLTGEASYKEQALIHYQQLNMEVDEQGLCR